MTKVFLRPRAVAGLNAASAKDQVRMRNALKVLFDGSFPPHTKKLEGSRDGHRTHVGRWRILFVLKDGEIDVADIFLKKGSGDYRRRKQR